MAMGPGGLISEDELHAYVDGALEPERRLDIALYLANHPLEAARTEAFRAQKEGIRALFDHVLHQPVPDALHKVMLRHTTHATIRRWVWAMAAGSMTAILLLGGYAFTDRMPLIRDVLIAPPSAQQHPAGTSYPAIPPAIPQVKPPTRRAGI
jgi:anti-sigma factor RsiW